MRRLVCKWLSEDRRQQLGHSLLIISHQRAPHWRCQRLPELSEDTYRALVRDLGKTNTSQRQDTKFSSALPPGLKLPVTATGDNCWSLNCAAMQSLGIWCQKCAKPSWKPDEWRALAQEFKDKWNVPHAELWMGSTLPPASRPTQALCSTTTIFSYSTHMKFYRHIHSHHPKTIKW